MGTIRTTRAAPTPVRARRPLGRAGSTVAGAAVLALVVAGCSTAGSAPPLPTGTASTSAVPVGEVLPEPVTGGPTTVEPPATVVTDTSGIPGVVAYDTSGWPTSDTPVTGHGLPHAHVTGPVVYSVTPPVGGDHIFEWMNCGVYDSPVPSERAVHNLEHGAVWITYEPSLPAAEVAVLRAFVDRQTPVTLRFAGGQPPVPTGERYVDLSPWKDASLGSPVVVSSWGRQLRLSSPTDPRLQRFVDAFRVNPTRSPEYGASCGGMPANVSGVPLAS